MQKTLKSPFFLGLVTGILFYFVNPVIIYPAIFHHVKYNFFMEFSIIPIIFVCIIGFLYSLIIKELMDIKYVIKFAIALIILTPLGLFYIPMLLDSIYKTNLFLVINFIFSLFLVFGFIKHWILTLISLLFICTALFFLNKITLNYIKLKEK